MMSGSVSELLYCFASPVLALYLPPMQVYTSLERYYNIVYDQQFSPSGKHVAACDSFGQISIFR